MAYKRPQLVNGEFYHIISRTVGDTVVFDDEKDFYRGIFSIYEFNNSNYVSIWKRRREIMNEKRQRPTLPDYNYERKDKRDRFVDILAFSFTFDIKTTER